MPPNLPGFYFDSEKNRYFKIQANHIAPTDSKYSRQAVQAEKVIRKVKRRDESVRRLKETATVTRSKLLQHPLLAFDRRLGDIRKSVTSQVAEYYAASLGGRDAITGRGLSINRGRTGSGYFAVDHDSGTLFVDMFGQVMRDAPPSATRLFAFHRRRELEERAVEEPTTRGDRSWPSTSIQDGAGKLYHNTDAETITLVARVENMFAIGSGLVIWAQSSGPTYRPQESRVKVAACQEGPFAERHDLVHECAFYNRIVDIVGQPRSSLGPSYLVSLATEGALWLMDTSTWRYPVAKYPLNQSDGTNDLMKIRFKDHNILMGGTRSGKMLLLDIREPPSSASRSSATRVQHSSAITNLHVLPDHNSILLAGLSTTSTYDLRYTPSPSLKCHAPGSNSYRLSPSILSFHIPETRWQNQYGLGWTYDPELNIMISASTDHVNNHRVGMWSVRTGRMIKSPLNEYVFPGAVRCADIARLRDGPKSILLSGGDDITEWSCQDVGTGEDG